MTAMSPHEQISQRLYRALLNRSTIAPLSRTHPDITLDQAYQISKATLALRESAGERLIGKKIGVTSIPVQSMLGVFQPDFGFLTDVMRYPDGSILSISRQLIQPRAEGEIAFVLKAPLKGPGVSPQQVLMATDYVCPCFEIVDSRIDDWQIGIIDTVADNASCGVFVLGEVKSRLTASELVDCSMVVTKNGSIISRGRGAEALGSPLSAVAWLANTLGRYGLSLDCGDIILSGSLVPLEPVAPGDTMSLQMDHGLGGVSVAFA